MLQKVDGFFMVLAAQYGDGIANRKWWCWRREERAEEVEDGRERERPLVKITLSLPCLSFSFVFTERSRRTKYLCISNGHVNQSSQEYAY